MRIKYNGHILTKSELVGSAAFTAEQPGPSLPPYTIRLKFNEGVTPTFSKGTGVQVSSSPNIWDLTYENTNWGQLLSSQTGLIEVIVANTSGVVYMNYMFSGCSSLTTVSLFDTSSVENMLGMFGNCSSLTTIPLFDTSSVTNMSTMFNGCTGLTTVPLFNTSSVTNISTMFRNCTSLTTVPLFNTSSVTNMSTMFYGCTGLTTIPLFNTSSVTNMSNTFRGCTNVQSGALALYQASTHVISHTAAFRNCGSNTVTGAAELAQIPSDWK